MLTLSTGCRWINTGEKPRRRLPPHLFENGALIVMNACVPPIAVQSDNRSSMRLRTSHTALLQWVSRHRLPKTSQNSLNVEQEPETGRASVCCIQLPFLGSLPLMTMRDCRATELSEFKVAFKITPALWSGAAFSRNLLAGLTPLENT